MKKRIIQILCFVGLLLLISCTPNDKKAEEYGKEAEEKQEQISREESEDGGKKDKSSVTDNSWEKTSPKMQPWEQAYLDYLEEFDENGACTYSLIYVDEDEIPELVIDTGAQAGGCQILTWHDGTLDGLQTSRLYFTYIEKGNLLCNSEGNMGYYFDNVYTIQDGIWEFLEGGTYQESGDAPEFDENYTYEYEWQERPVEEAEYERLFHAVYPEKQATEPERYYIKDEICSLFRTKALKSANHRYELIVEDLTWSEAAEACEEKGGYLATITSREEFERIQEQILSEEKTTVTFFVGGNRKREKGMGYGWLEPGTENGYSMLELYNALFAGFWLKDEPSYTGLTEDGAEVEEDCISLIYRSTDGRCYLNDVPDDILQAAPSFAGRVGYICEFDE